MYEWTVDCRTLNPRARRSSTTWDVALPMFIAHSSARAIDQTEHRPISNVWAVHGNSLRGLSQRLKCQRVTMMPPDRAGIGLALEQQHSRYSRQDSDDSWQDRARSRHEPERTQQDCPLSPRVSLPLLPSVSRQQSSSAGRCARWPAVPALSPLPVHARSLATCSHPLRASAVH